MTPSLESPAPPSVRVEMDSMEDLIARHTEPLLRTALGLGFDTGTAEELVQDTFVAFLEARDKFEGRSKVSTFLFGILYNKTREWRRAQGKEPSLDAIEEKFDGQFIADGHWGPSLGPDLSEPEQGYHQGEIAHLLTQCLDDLPMAHRMAFTLKEAQGLPTPALCEALQTTATHIGVLLFRARNALRDCLKSKL